MVRRSTKLLVWLIILRCTQIPIKRIAVKANPHIYVTILILVSTLDTIPSFLSVNSSQVPMKDVSRRIDGPAIPCQSHLVNTSSKSPPWISLFLSIEKSIMSHAMAYIALITRANRAVRRQCKSKFWLIWYLLSVGLVKYPESKLVSRLDDYDEPCEFISY